MSDEFVVNKYCCYCVIILFTILLCKVCNCVTALRGGVKWIPEPPFQNFSKHLGLSAAGVMHWLRCFPIILEIILAIHHSGAAAVLGQRLSFVAQSTCTYDYEVAVHTARGTRSTVSEGFHLHALVSRKNLFTVFLLLRKLGFSRIKSSVCAKGRAHSKISEALRLDRLFTPSYWCSRIGGIVRVNCTTLDHCTTHHSCCIALFRKYTKILRWEGEERGKYFLKNNVVRHMSIKIWCEFATACFGAEAPN